MNGAYAGWFNRDYRPCGLELLPVRSQLLSPTIFREGPYRFFFFSREEPRIHVHVASGEGEAKFWLSPEIELAENHGLAEREITKLDIIIRDHEQEIRDAWNRHFGN